MDMFSYRRIGACIIRFCLFEFSLFCVVCWFGFLFVWGWVDLWLLVPVSGCGGGWFFVLGWFLGCVGMGGVEFGFGCDVGWDGIGMGAALCLLDGCLVFRFGIVNL